MNREVEAKWLFQKKRFPIDALRVGNTIFIPQCIPFLFLENYFHEVGHIIAWQFSFKDGEVLTPDEAKVTKVEGISNKTNMGVMWSLAFSLPGKEESLLDFANRILLTYTKGKIDFNSFRVNYNYPKKSFERLVRGSIERIQTAALGNSGEIILTSSSEGRNTEIPSYAVQRACIKLMENTLDLSKPIPYKKADNWLSSSHARAFNIVNRAYTGTGIILPSYLDMVGKNF